MAQNKSKLPLKQGGMLALIGLGSAAVLAGCGGATTNQPNLRPTQAQSVVAFGVNATAAVQAGSITEISGLGSASDTSVLFITGAVASTAVVQATIAGASGTIPLGFSPGVAGGPSGTTIMTPVAPSQTGVIFGAAIANGLNPTTNALYPVTGAAITQADGAAYSQPMTFVGVNGGALSNATYQTGSFTLPFTTFGLHSFTVAASDSKPETTTTTYKVLVLNAASGVGAVYASTIGGNAIAPGSTASITGQVTPAAPATAQTTADEFGTVILFAAPGTQTLTITPAGGTPVTQTVTVAAGSVTVQ